MRSSLVAVVVTALCGCSGASAPTAPTAAVQSRNFSDLPPLAGSYALTVDLDPACSQFPADARQRVYGAQLVDHGWHFLPIQVSGGAYGESMQIAELFSSQFSAPPGALRLQWNEIDTGCDILEPLGESRRLAVCGEGSAQKTDGGFDAAIHGDAVAWDGTTTISCRGTHRFSFIRTR